MDKGFFMPRLFTPELRLSTKRILRVLVSNIFQATKILFADTPNI